MYKFPHRIESEYEPTFASKGSQDIAKFVGVDWKLHCTYRPQSSGRVERINKTLKEILTKLTLDTGGTGTSVPSLCPI